MIPTIDTVATGNNIYQLIHNSDMTVNDLKIEMQTVTVQAIYKWLRGECLPSIDNLFVMSRIFGVTIEEIVILRKE